MKLSVEEQNRPDANWSGRGLVGGIQNDFSRVRLFFWEDFAWWIWNVSE